MPVAKRERHRKALRIAATSGDPKFFLGTDSAPHLRSDKESACGCAGIFNSPYAIESYAEVFSAEGKLYNLEAFSSLNGPNFYRLPINKQKINLIREPFTVEQRLDGFVPFHAGEQLSWKVQK